MTGLPFVNPGHPDGSHKSPSPFNSPQLPPNILRFIHHSFGSDDDLHIDCIQSSSIRILKELTDPEQIEVIRQFKGRFKKSKNAFRNICVKMWSQNRAAKKAKLLQRARINFFRPSAKCLVELCGIHTSPLIADTIELLFTPGSGLHLSIIDRSIEHRLNQLSDHDGIEVLFEFCRSAMYQQDRIKNLSAFLNHMLMQKMNTISNCSTLSTVSRDSIRTNLSIQSMNCSVMDCRSETAHYSVTSGSSLSLEQSHCCSETVDPEAIDIVEEEEEDENTECALNTASALDAHWNGIESRNGCDDAKDTTNDDHHNEDKTAEQKELDAMIHSFAQLQEQMMAQRKELELLKHSVKEVEQKNKTLKAENQCLRERRGGSIANDNYRQRIAFWDGDLKRTPPGIDVIPIQTVGRGNNHVAMGNTGYFTVGIPTAVNGLQGYPMTMNMYQYYQSNGYMMPR